MRVLVAIVALTLLLLSGVYGVHAANCQNVNSFSASCTGGTIIQDTYNGCRTIKCASGSSSMQILACDKPDGAVPQYFEMYKQSKVGTAVTRICLGSLCLDTNGYAKSAAYSTYTCGSPPPTCVPTAEVCDGKDNNCNGQIDEGLTQQITCGIGTCAQKVTQKCSAGTYTPACVPGTPTTEICDNKDNNCNGQVDENNVCGPTCTPSTEVCDGKDNNCNGQIDEGLAKQTTCGIGACTRTIAQTCSAGTYTPTCTPGAPTTEICNGIDDNCNGQIDENNICSTNTTNSTNSSTCSTSVFTANVTCTSTITKDVSTGCRSVVCGVNGNTITTSACDKTGYFEVYRQAATGTPPKVCFGTTCIQNEGYVKSAACTTTPPASCVPTTEICDGKDNNCNGQIDEGLTRQISCGIGACTRTITQTCSAGTYTPTCTPRTPTTEICNGIDDNCNGQTDENNVCGSTSQYPLKTGIISTIFWVGQGPSADTGGSNNYDSAWDVWWQEHYGGYDDPNNRNGYYPVGFTPRENPFYVAIPYTDFSTTGRKPDAFTVVPWSNEKATWGFQESMIKNRWVKIIKGAKTAYAQVENAGPGPTDDWPYVFGSNSQPTTDFGWHAGIDVSPAVRDYLGLGPVDNVSWQWVNASGVPAGPWKTIVTTRQSCWASTICP